MYQKEWTTFLSRMLCLSLILLKEFKYVSVSFSKIK